ncbi:ABC transporter I family member 19-like protein [Trifolium pratense]|uniref:ABC transporter I family member 19-like protein n=1 Tax=Trifolium pratense TaxID=57577 RepID=A0A2K3LY70_TRIPR|nr:ABC transporter I family member 19-like protein [Trifolium pratense]
MAIENSGGIQVQGMQFSYDGLQPPLFLDFNLHVSPGSRCLLVGANGSGKTTLLKILAGKHMVGGRDVVRVLNSSAFHDTQLVCSGDLAYLGGSWSKNIGCAVSSSFFC